MPLRRYFKKAKVEKALRADRRSKRMPDSEKLRHFWARAEIQSEFYCWNWKGEIDGKSGYGKYQKNTAHRRAYILTFGDIPSRILVRHKCDNRICVNPNHLVVGTHLDNSRDMWERNCSVPAPLSEDQVREIRKSSETNREAGKRFGRSHKTIGYIRQNKKYKWVELC